VTSQLAAGCHEFSEKKVAIARRARPVGRPQGRFQFVRRQFCAIGGCPFVNGEERQPHKQFASKEDLAAEASKRALESATLRWSAAAAAKPEDPLGALIAFYLSTEHREEKTNGCPVVALGSDAARQGSDVKASFEAGIKAYLEILDRLIAETDGEEPNGKAMVILSMMVGALTLSRVVNDSDLAQVFLDRAVEHLHEVVAA
jgi:TetR/AcrR family transcriptional regulator, transcriptional repressor for nem operon